MKTEPKTNIIVLHLVQEEAKELKDNKIQTLKNESGEIQYLRQDAIGLMRLLNYFDSRQHSLRDSQAVIMIKDKGREAFLHKKLTIELSIDEAAFLKTYLKDLMEKDAKTVPMQEFELRSLNGLLAALE